LTRVFKVEPKEILLLFFFCLASLNIFLSLSPLAELFRLPYLVLMPQHLGLMAWVISGSAFAWICMLMAKSHLRCMLYFGILTQIGSLLQLYEIIVTSLSVSLIGVVMLLCGTIPSVVMAVKYSREVFSTMPAEAARLFLRCLLAIVIPLQIWAIATVLPFARTPKGYPRFNMFLSFERLLELLLPLTTLLFILLITEWLWFPLITRMVKKRINRHPLYKKSDAGKKILPFDTWLVAGFAMLLAVLISGYQWSLGYPLGQDARYYTYVLHRMGTSGVQIALSTERPFLFLALYAVEKILGIEVSLLLRFIPVVLAPLLVGAICCFSKFVGSRRDVAVLAALLAAISPHIAVGVEYFIVANMFGILMMMLFLFVFSQSVLKSSISWALLAFVLSILTLGMHYFTWIFMILVLFVYILLNLVEQRFHAMNKVLFSIKVFLGCIGALVPPLFFSYLKGGTSEGLTLAQHMVNLFLTHATPINLVTFLQSNEQIYNYFGREHYAIPVLYVLAMIGLAQLNIESDDRRRMLAAWFIASSVGTIVVQQNELWRFLYMIPLEIAAAFGLGSVLTWISFERNRGMNEMNRISLKIGLQLGMFLTVGILLAFSSLPSFIALFCLGLFAFSELLLPTEGRCETTVLVVMFLVLEQTARALYTLS
jgi:hypothetical protein